MNRIHRYALAAAVTLLVAACGERSESPLSPSLESSQQVTRTTTVQTTSTTTSSTSGTAAPVESDTTYRGGYSIGGN